MQSQGCPDHNLGGYKCNQEGMTLNPYFSDLKRTNDTWSVLQKQDVNGIYPNRPKDIIGGLLGGFEDNQPQPYEDLRNRWNAAPSQSPRTQSFGPSIYQKDYVSSPIETIIESKQLKNASYLQQARQNMYRPQPPRRGWQGSNEWIPKRPIACQPCTGVRIPCRHPSTNVSSNVHLDHGFGTYRTETQDQFDRPTALAFDHCTYQVPSGYSTSTGRRFWSTQKACDEDDYRSRRQVVTPPQRYNPWPRFFIGHETLLRHDYRPKNMDYQEYTVAGTTSFEPHTFIV